MQNATGTSREITHGMFVALRIIMENFRHAAPLPKFTQKPPDMSDDDDFVDNLTSAIHGARSNSLLLGAAPPKNRKTCGLKKMKTKIQIYYLPDAAPLPKFMQKPKDPLIHQHFTSGYGKYTRLLTSLLSSGIGKMEDN